MNYFSWKQYTALMKSITFSQSADLMAFYFCAFMYVARVPSLLLNLNFLVILFVFFYVSCRLLRNKKKNRLRTLWALFLAGNLFNYTRKCFFLSFSSTNYTTLLLFWFFSYKLDILWFFENIFEICIEEAH